MFSNFVVCSVGYFSFLFPEQTHKSCQSTIHKIKLFRVNIHTYYTNILISKKKKSTSTIEDTKVPNIKYTRTI